MLIDEFSWNSGSTRYGYNGTHEQDREMNADGNYLDFGNFGYDTRVAMRRNQEPLRAKYPHLSGYSAFGSNPIIFSDTDDDTKFIWKDNYTFGNAADVGNYHAGYTGKYLYNWFGLPDNILLFGAGYAEISKNYGEWKDSKSNSDFKLLKDGVISMSIGLLQIVSKIPYPTSLLSPLDGSVGDRPRDNYWNKKGMKDAKKSK